MQDSVHLLVQAGVRPSWAKNAWDLKRTEALVDTGAVVSIVQTGLLPDQWFQER